MSDCGRCLLAIMIIWYNDDDDDDEENEKGLQDFKK